MKTDMHRAMSRLAVVMAFTIPLQAHHSFAPFDQSKTRVFTGVVTRVNPDANHLQIYFAVMNEERKNVLRNDDGSPMVWEVELAGSAAAAAEGVTVDSFPRGVVFSTALRPMRNCEPKGLRQGAMFRCPAGADGRSTPPPPESTVTPSGPRGDRPGRAGQAHRLKKDTLSVLEFADVAAVHAALRGDLVRGVGGADAAVAAHLPLAWCSSHPDDRAARGWGGRASRCPS